MSNADDPSQYVLYECADGIATITLNRPEKLNAFNDDMVRRMAEVLHQFDTDEDAIVAIIRGAGRAFCSGADVHQRQLRTEDEMRQHGSSQGWNANASELLVRSINWKPLITVTHGYAVGLGLGLALESDLWVTEPDTKFQVTETSRGLGASRYWALLGFRGLRSFATEVVLTGRFFTPQEALTAGMVDRVAPQGQSMDVAIELAQQIVKNPPLSVRATVRTRRWYMDQAEREAYLQTTPLKLHLTEDFKESARAFAEKRPAGPFKGR